MKKNILFTAVLLMLAIVIIPVAAFFYDEPLSDLQKGILKNLAYAMCIVAMLCFIAGELTNNYSQTDKLWSIMPLVYTVYVAYASAQPRVALMTFLVMIWSARLTYNFNRRGGYSWKFWEGEEDYRWTVLRREKFLQGKFRVAAFNLFFISFYQQALILAFTLPAVAVAGKEKPIGIFDVLLSVLFLLLVAVETMADQQQWNFQQKKLAAKNGNASSELRQGFISSGLWSIVRHPNYAAEQSIWIVFYMFSIVATGRWINWSMAGCVLLMLLFQGSADFTEQITAQKYPGYKEYKKRVSRFLPKLFS
jgi:steroid 5-alpha reductase family enzyme